jgi:hypothetical protein
MLSWTGMRDHAAIVRVAIFACTLLRTSGSGGSSIRRGLSRGHSSHFGCLQAVHSSPLAAAPGNMCLHSWHSWCGTELGPNSSPG